jgi:hypothetical protein
MFPGLVKELERGASLKESPEILARFFLPNLPPCPGMNDDEMAILELLEKQNPLPVRHYQEFCLNQGRLFGGLKRLSHPSILVAAFTPTDAMSVLGLYSEGDPAMSLAGARLLGQVMGLGPIEFSRLVLNSLGHSLAQEIAYQALAAEGLALAKKDLAPGGSLSLAVGGGQAKGLSLELRLYSPVIVLGAPAAILAPYLGKYLKATILTPPASDVASAVGAAASRVSLVRKIDIVTLPNFAGYRAFLPDGPMDGNRLEKLAQETEERMGGYMLSLAKLAGASDTSEVSCHRVNRSALMRDGSRLVMGLSLTFQVEGQVEGQVKEG